MSLYNRFLSADLTSASIPVVALVDGDAYGLDIAAVYKFGSGSLKHEAHKLVAERLECIGLFASELEMYVHGPSYLCRSTSVDVNMQL